MDILKTPHQMLLEEAGALPETPGMLNTPQQMLMQESGIMPHYALGGSFQQYASGGNVSNSLPNVSFDARSIPSMSGMPGIGHMQTPQGAMARMQFEKELENKARVRAGVSGMGMAIPGQQGVKLMPGQMDVGANMPVGPGHLDVSANRSINPVPGRGHMQGVNARYSIPFAEGGEVSPQDMLAELIYHGHTPEHFAPGGNVEYDQLGNAISGSYLGPEATGKTKHLQSFLHNLAAIPVTAGMGAANTGAGIAQYLGYKEPAKALKQITEGISQTAPIGGAIGELGGSMMDPATTGVLKAGAAIKPGAANWLTTTGLSGLQGYLSPVESEDDRLENAGTTVAFNTALLGLGKTGETAKTIYKKIKRK